MTLTPSLQSEETHLRAGFYPIATAASLNSGASEASGSAVPRSRRFAAATILPRSIRGKLLLTFLLLGVITGSLGVNGIIQLRHAGQLTATTYDRPLMAINYARSAQTIFGELGNKALDEKRAALVKAGAEDPAQSMLDNLDVAEQRAPSAVTAKLVRDVHALSLRWLAARQNLQTQATAVRPDDFREEAALADKLRDAFEQMSEQMAADGFVHRRLAVGAARSALQTSIIATSIAIMLSLIMTLIMSRRIVGPISAAADVANRIASGDFQTPIPSGGNDEAGALLSSLAYMRDRILERGRSAQDRLVAAMESSSEAMMLLDEAGHVVISNSRVTSLLEIFTINLREGKTFAEAFPFSAASWAPRIQTPGEIELPDGKWLNVSQQKTADGGSFLMLSDVTYRKSYERKLETAAYVDSLTQIQNRSYLIDRFDQKRDTEDSSCRRALLVLDIDNFRMINTRHGTRSADQVLIVLAQRIRRLVGRDDVCARIGGNEFALYVSDADEQEADRLIDAIQGLRGQPIRIAGQEVPLCLSAGVSVTEDQTTSGLALLYQARMALDRAKQRGGDQTQFFGDDLRKEARTRLIIQQDLPEAIRQQTIYMEYQPIISFRTGETSGLEALVRWRHPELGQIPPLQFVGVAEETGTIIELGELVLEQATRATTRWIDAHRLGANFTTAINLSPRQIADPRHARKILDFLDRNQQIARQIKLEITEGVLLDNPTAMAALLKEFKLRGVQLSLDDFGTGYSSLSYLHKFTFDILKIDRSFVIRMDESTEALRLVKTIIELGHDLGMETVAEGVETEQQAQHLRLLGSDYGQGYLFSRPLPEAAISSFLTRDRAIGAIAAA